MQHFFVTPEQVEENRIRINGSDVNHIKNVLRMKPGEKIEISDGNNQKYLCEITGMDGQEVIARILEREKTDTELPVRIVLFQGLPKADKMEWIVQKTVELGVHEIIPVVTKRTVVKLDEKKAEKRRQRWQAIAESAAKQAGRGKIPEVKRPVKYCEALEEAADMELVLIPYELAESMEQTRTILSKLEKGMTVGIFIGPEGGFEKEEVKEAIEQAKAFPITLGRRILRTETAGSAVLSILTYLLEE